MIKHFFKDSFIYSISGIITGGIAFFLLPLYARIFNAFDFGIYEYLTIFGSFIGVTIALEITQGVARFIPENLDTPIIKKSYASTSLWFTVFTFSLFIFIVIFFKEFLAYKLLDSKELANLLVISCLSFSFSAIANLINNQLRWELKSMQSAILSIIISTASIFFSFVFVYFFKYGVIGAFYGLITGNAISIIIGFIFTHKSYGFIFNAKQLKEMLLFSYPLVFSSMAGFLANYIDRIAIKDLMSFSDVAIYGVGFRISAIAMLIMFGFQSAMTPIIFANYKKAETPAEIAKIFRIFLVFALIILSILSLFSRELILLFATKEYLSSYKIVPILVLSILLSRMYIFFPGIGIKKRTAITALIYIISAILNIFLNYLFIPYWGIMGAAIATSFTSFLCLYIYIFFSQQFYFVPHKWRNIILCSSSIIIGVIFINFSNYNHAYYLFIKSLALIFIVFILFQFKLIEIDDLNIFIRLIKKKINNFIK